MPCLHGHPANAAGAGCPAGCSGHIRLVSSSPGRSWMVPCLFLSLYYNLQGKERNVNICYFLSFPIFYNSRYYRAKRSCCLWQHRHLAQSVSITKRWKPGRNQTAVTGIFSKALPYRSPPKANPNHCGQNAHRLRSACKSDAANPAF